MWFSLYRWKGVKSRTSAFSGVKSRTLRQSATFYPQWITVQFVSKHGGTKSGGKKTGGKKSGDKKTGGKKSRYHATEAKNYIFSINTTIFKILKI